MGQLFELRPAFSVIGARHFLSFSVQRILMGGLVVSSIDNRAYEFDYRIAVSLASGSHGHDAICAVRSHHRERTTVIGIVNAIDQGACRRRCGASESFKMATAHMQDHLVID